MSDLEQRSQIDIAIENLLRRDAVSRRTFFRKAGRGGVYLAGVLSLPAILAACAPNASPAAKLAWLNWTGYMDISDDGKTNPSLAAFTKQTGIKVEYSEGLTDNAEFLAQYTPDLKAGHPTGWDVMSPGGWVVARMAKLGFLEELDHSMLSNWTANCTDFAKGLWYDPENKHSLYWQGGLTGIAYDPNQTGREITSFDDLLDPAFSGRAGGFSDMRDMFGLTLLSLGVEPAKATIADVTKAQKKLLAVPKGHFRGFYGNEYYDALAAGDLAICVAWSGDVSQIQLYDNDKVKFVVPVSGGMRWNDNVVIPKGGTSFANAHKLIDYYYDPAAATMLSEFVGYFSPVKGVSERILADAQAARDAGDTATADTLEKFAPTVVPAADQIANTYPDKQLSEEEDAKWNDLFNVVLGG